MSSFLKLSALPIGTTAVVRELSKTGTASVRLREMGLLTGTKIVLVRAAPLGDPLEIRIGNTRLSLRNREAACVLVTKL